MPTLGAVPGKLIKVFRGEELTIPATTYAAIGCQTTGNLAITATELAQACKDAGGWSEGAQGDKSASLTVDLLTKYDATVGRAEVLADMLSGQVRAYQWTTDVTGDPVEDFAAYISSFSESADVSDLASISVTLSITGAVSTGVVA